MQSTEIARTADLAVNIAYRVSERGGDQAILFLHGTSANLGVWDEVIDATREPGLCVAVDQRGHGRSDKPATGYGADEYCDDMVALQDALGLGPLVIVGHSLGARNAWVFAARHPDRVAGVLAVDYVPFVELEVLDALAVRVAAGDRVFDSPDDIGHYLRDRYPRISPQAVDRRTSYGYRSGPDGYIPLASSSALQQTVAGLRVDYPDEFERVEAPLTAVRGVDSAIVSPDAWQRALGLLPSARSVDADADHYVPEEQPVLVAREVDRLLSAIAERSGNSVIGKFQAENRNGR
jgi:2-(acetamidomethylene)succinate hydrolase